VWHDKRSRKSVFEEIMQRKIFRSFFLGRALAVALLLAGILGSSVNLPAQQAAPQTTAAAHGGGYAEAE